jgi:hypothetical protein
MQLKDFFNNSRIYSFNIDGTANEVKDPNNDSTFCGFISQISNGSFAAVYKHNNALFFQIGKLRWNFDGNIKINYKHDTLGKTHFNVITEEKTDYNISYDSWWRSGDYPVPGLGLPDDEEEDILAYIAVINESPEMQSGLLKNWNNC